MRPRCSVAPDSRTPGKHALQIFAIKPMFTADGLLNIFRAPPARFYCSDTQVTPAYPCDVVANGMSQTSVYTCSSRCLATIDQRLHFQSVVRILGLRVALGHVSQCHARCPHQLMRMLWGQHVSAHPLAFLQLEHTPEIKRKTSDNQTFSSPGWPSPLRRLRISKTDDAASAGVVQDRTE